MKNLNPSSARVVNLTLQQRAPQRIARMNATRSLLALSAAAFTLFLTGCGAGTFHALTATPAPAVSFTGHAISGRAMGGQQPIAGATVQIYAAATIGYGVAAVPVGPSVTTAADGSFTTGTINCTTGTYLYLTSVGGNPGAGANTNSQLFAALGLCDTVNSLSYAVVNEISTVGSAYALGAFMVGPTTLSSSAGNVKGLGLAFADATQLFNLATGLPAGTTLPANATLPIAEINTVANAMASCVNSTGGVAGDPTACGSFFAATTTPAGAKPTDTLTAVLNIVHYPAAVDVATLYNTGNGTSPFQPALTAQPNDFTLAVNYAPAGMSKPSGIAFDSTGSAYISDKAGSIFKVAHSGALLATQSPQVNGALGAFSSVAVDPADGVFATNPQTTGSTVRHYKTDFSTTYNQLLPDNGPSDVAIDQNGFVWFTYATDSALTQSDANVTVFNKYTGAGISLPLGIAISTN